MSEETKGPACDNCGASAGSPLKTPEQNVAMWNQRSEPMEYADDN